MKNVIKQCKNNVFTLFFKDLAYILQMGNHNYCCAKQALGGNAIINLRGSTTMQKPLILSDKQQTFINSKNPFPKQMKNVVTLKMSQGDIFQGQLDEKGNPKGYGLFQIKDQQAIYFGNFNETGTQQGKLYYLLRDGTYFEGNLMAQSGITGIYVQSEQKYRYEGEFQHKPGQQLKYLPHGKGTQQSDTYEFIGSFQEGKRVQGKLKWASGEYTDQYQGFFDQGQLFGGKGVLTEISGVYTGHFAKGKKEGQGKYEYTKGIKYQGEYREGRKNGQGKLYNSDGTVSYQGEFEDGLPHGNGTAYWQGKSLQTQFFNGITKRDYEALTVEANLSKQKIQY